MNSKRKNTIIIGVITVCIAVFLFVGTSFAWLHNPNKVNFNNIKGNVTYITKYFESGDGTEENPYEIKTPDQLHNLAWLQYLGFFNESKDGIIETPYFYLSSNLDMEGYVLPPIGSSNNPFIGNFDGKDKTIENLKVANTVGGENGIPEEELPYIFAVEDVKQIEDVDIVGLFGVVGTLRGDTTGRASNMLPIVDKNGDDATYSSSANEIHNLTISNIIVTTQTKTSLAGIAAGYVNGKLSNVGIVDSNINFASGITNVSNKYANINTQNLSDYTTVGYCTEAYKNNLDIETVEQKEPEVEIWRKDSSAGEEEEDNAWGGSIDILDLFGRLKNFRKKAFIDGVQPLDKKKNYIAYSNELDPASGATTYYQLSNPTSAGSIDSIGLYYLSGRGNNMIDGSIVLPETYMPISADEQGKVVSSNNGYIVSGSMLETTSSYKADIRVKRESGSNTGTGMDKISGSYKKGSDNFDEIFTINENGLVSTKSQNSPFNSFAKYKESSDLLLASFKKSSNDSAKGNIYGFHFMNVSVSKDNYATVPKVQMNGKTYQNYQMPRDTIDFTLKKKGFINFFAGNYFTDGGGNKAFFSLFKVDRNADNTIKTIKRIESIYDNHDGTYAYEFKDAGSTGASTWSDEKTHSATDKIFDLKWIEDNGTLVSNNTNRLFYFEIPVNEGEYALGSVEGATGAYLLYLDISANAQDVPTSINCQQITEVTKTTTGSNECPKGVQVVGGNAGFTSATESASVAVKNAGQNISLRRSGNTITFVGSGKAVYKGENITLNDSNGQAMEVALSADKVKTQKKITSIEYDPAAKKTTIKVTTITEVKGTSGNVTSRTYEVTVDGEKINEEDSGISVETEAPTIISYHYNIPTNSNVSNQFNLTSDDFDENTGLIRVKDEDYPEAGEAAVPVEGMITKYDITITPDTDIGVREDSLADGYTAIINGEEFKVGNTVNVKKSQTE